MLRFLRIRNLAVIEAAEVEFEPGFNVLTGETGAGKSILVEAVALLVGARASADLVRTGESQATIEAIFDDRGREILVRREITSQGRSRSYVDGALATAGALRGLAVRLVELLGQHEHHALLDPQTHLPLLDEYAHLNDRSSQVASAFAAMRSARDELERSRMDAREKTARLDLIAFQLAEIEKVGPRPGEDDELSATRQVLANAERVVRLCEESYAALYESDQAVLTSLSGVWKRVGELASLDPTFTPHMDAREDIKSQLEELAFSLRRYADGIDVSPTRLHEVEDRLASIERLKRKYGPTLEDVVTARASLARERDLLTGGHARAEDLERILEVATAQYLHLARDLSARRRAAAAAFGRELEALLADLAMSRTRFEVRFADRLPEGAWTERGIDAAEFYVSPNPGEELRPLARIVSGGELSRIMLALKTLEKGGLPDDSDSDGGGARTLIFDEVDAGIGGRVAEVVGGTLRKLGDRHQVLCITHLPQIAAKGSTQFRIDKQLRSGRTVVSVERLDLDGRVEEIARMIGGAAITPHVRASARDLLSLNVHNRAKAKAKGESESRRRG